MEENSTQSTILSRLSSLLIQTTTKNVTFSWYDYILFTFMLLISAIIGIYFGCFGNKQNTESEYLLGGRKMKVFPIAVSLTASHISGITLLAVPAEVYRFGATILISPISMCITAIVTIFVYLPVFFKLKITSTYEYLEMRFDSKCRMLASFLFTLNMLLYLPIVIYIPALAFSAATGLNVHVITAVVCGVCIFYTTIGGLKAVVWTDTIQFTVTVATLCAVFYLGLKSVGGFSSAWQTATEGHRTDIFNMTLDPTSRDTFWPILVGFTNTWIAVTAINQGCVQKFLSLPTLREANMAVVLYSLGCCAILSCSIIIGLIMYAYYAGCDPFTTGEIQKSDQLLPYYVMEVGGQIPGLSGLFIAGVFCAALSTLSAHLNCLAGTLYEDFIAKVVTVEESSKTAILKLLVVVIGVICTATVILIEKLGNIFMLQVTLSSITMAPLLGLFTMGVLCPFIGKKGAFYGTITGLLLTTCLVATAQYYKSQGYIKEIPKPISIENCTDNLEISWRYGNDINRTESPIPFLSTAIYQINTTDLYNISSPILETSTSNKEENWQPFILFRIASMYYVALGFIATMIAALLIGCFETDKEPLDKEVLSPIIHFLLPKKKTDYKYYSIEKSVHVLAYGKEKDIKN